MRVLNVATELAPYVTRTDLGGEISSLLDAFVKRGHEVHAVLPVGAGADLSAFSLARRLKAIAVEHGGREVLFTRFEGKTPSGVNVVLVQPQEALAPEVLLGAFPGAAVEVLRAMAGEPCACVAWNRECASVSSIDQRAGKPVAASHLLALRGDIAGFEAWLEDGRAVALPIAVEAHPPLSTAEKATAKAALQAAFGLPVRARVPLASFGALSCDVCAEVLFDYLRGDVQAVMASDVGPDESVLSALAARYPDRLSLVPKETPFAALLAGADIAVIADPRATVRAMSFGAIPVTVTECAEGAVDLEPSLASGSAFIANDLSAKALASTLGRAVTAFHLGAPFCALALRLQKRALDWDKLAEKLEQLLEVAAVR